MANPTAGHMEIAGKLGLWIAKSSCFKHPAAMKTRSSSISCADQAGLNNSIQHRPVAVPVPALETRQRMGLSVDEKQRQEP